MYSLRWLLFWSLLGCSVVASVLLTLLPALVFFKAPPPHQHVATLWQPFVNILGTNTGAFPSLSKLSEHPSLPVGWQVLGLASVDLQSQLLEQQGVFPQAHTKPWQAFMPGDLGAQLPILSRDDLADALTARPNNGVEQWASDQFLLVQPLPSETTGQPIAAVILALQAPANWQTELDWFWLQWPFWQTLLQQVLILFPFLLPAGLGLIWLISARWRRQAAQISLVIEKWSVGDFQQRLQIKKPDEIGQTFVRLNQLADSLQHLLQQRQQWAALQERQQLAAALHDTVKQQLFVNNLTLAGCQQQLPPEAPSALAGLLQQAIAGNQQAFRQVSHLLDQLTEPIASVLPAEQLRQRIQTLATDQPWQLTLSLPEKPIPALLVSVLDEALANIAKHAGTGVIQVQVLIEQSVRCGWYLKVQNQLTIADTTASSQNPGQGLKILSQRLATQGGRLLWQQPVPEQFQLEAWLP